MNTTVAYILSIPVRAGHRLEKFKRLCFSIINRIIFSHKINQDTIFATSFYGMKYGDNPAYIIEELHRRRPNLKIYWEKNAATDFRVPEYVNIVRSFSFEYFYRLFTSRILINSHDWSPYYRKNKKQFLLNTWHGGLGIKKIAGDNKRMRNAAIDSFEITSKLGPSDLVISNSTHLTQILRRAFNYSGSILECGYPKTDLMFNDKSVYRKKIREFYGLSQNDKLILYVPTIRIYLHEPIFKNNHPYPYDLDFDGLKSNLERHFSGTWQVLVRKHPCMNSDYQQEYRVDQIGIGNFIDATSYPDIQELIMGCDACISDFSSTIFDAALLKMPCFTYANDEEYYKKDIGTYYQLNDLPFPTAKNNQELENVISVFDEDKYQKDLTHFFNDIAGLHETGQATQTIADLLCRILDGKNNDLRNP